MSTLVILGVIRLDTLSLYNNYSFDWEGTKILDTETDYNKRRISKKLHIKEQMERINSQRNTESLTKSLDESYFILLESIRNNNNK